MTAPAIDWDRVRSIDDVILPDPFPEPVDGPPDLTDHEHCEDIGECWQLRHPCPALDRPRRLDRIDHGSRVVDRAGNRFLLMGWGSVQGTVILRDRYRRMFHADGGMRLERVQ